MNKSDQSSLPLRILVVEDESVVAMDMEMQLLACGYEVAAIARTGEEALHLVGTIKLDLVLMDVQLRGSLDGFDTATEMQKIEKLPIVFITAFSSKESQRRAQAISPYGFLTKPYRPDDLQTTVAAALEQHKLK